MNSNSKKINKFDMIALGLVVGGGVVLTIAIKKTVKDIQTKAALNAVQTWVDSNYAAGNYVLLAPIETLNNIALPNIPTAA